MIRLDEFVARRRVLAARYDELLKDLPLVTPYVLKGANPSWHIYIVRVDFSHLKKTKKQIFEEMKAQGFILNLHYIPVHTQPYYQSLGYRPENFPNAMIYYAEALTLPLYYDLTDEQQTEVTAALKKVLTQ